MNSSGNEPIHDRTASREEVLNALRGVVDPEIGLNVVDMGLIYDVELSGSTVRIAATLTNASCPLQDLILRAMRSSVLRTPGITECDLRLVWDPPWNPAMISEAGQAFLKGN